MKSIAKLSALAVTAMGLSMTAGFANGQAEVEDIADANGNWLHAVDEYYIYSDSDRKQVVDYRNDRNAGSHIE